MQFLPIMGKISEKELTVLIPGCDFSFSCLAKSPQSRVAYGSSSKLITTSQSLPNNASIIIILL